MFVKFVVLLCFATDSRSELQQISVVFRHGDRAPDHSNYETYPNDPYGNLTYFPMGSGGLTNTGKMREYRLGEYLRKEYDHFLGPMYYKGVLSARSTFTERTKQCLQLLLAGLYPPQGNQTWNLDLKWQPIPTYFKARLDDVLMVPQDCPKYVEALEKVKNSTEYQRKVDKFQPLMNQLTIATGKDIKTPNQMFYLYHNLMALMSVNLPVPKWSDGLFPYGELYQGTILNYQLASYNDELKRLNGGMLLRKITDDMTNACDGKVKDLPKLHLYSGHEVNVAALLNSLGAFQPHVPRYSSAVIIELHKRNNKCFVKVKYYRGLIRNTEKTSIIKDIAIPRSRGETSLLQFKQVLKNRIATNDDILTCNKRLLSITQNSFHPEIDMSLAYLIAKEHTVPSLLE